MQATENTTNIHRSYLKIRRRPSLSPSGPSTAAPKIAPTIAADDTSPVCHAEMPKSSLINGLATPMMKKSNPSSMMPRPARNQNRRCILLKRAPSMDFPMEGSEAGSTAGPDVDTTEMLGAGLG